MRSLALAVLAGCGRIGFDPGGATGDGNPGDAPMFVPAVGELDPTFGTAGITITSGGGTLDLAPYAVMPRPGGYLAVGVHGNAAGSSKIGLIGYTASGAIDPSFGIRDVGGIDDFGYGAVRIGANRIAVNGDGEIGTGDDFVLAMIDDAGALDPTFGGSGLIRFDVGAAMREDTANRIEVVGSTVIACGIGGYDATDATFALLRLGFDGQPVAGWGTGGEVTDELQANSQDECFDVVELGSDVIAVGRADDDRLVVVAYRESDGTHDPSFGNAGRFDVAVTNSRAIRAIAVGGELVVVGVSNAVGIVIRLGANGIPVSGFGNAGIVSLAALDEIDDVVAQPDGMLLIAGISNNKPVVARLTVDGNLDATFATGGILTIPASPIDIRGVTLDPDGKLVIAGINTTTPNTAFVARIR